MEGSPLFGSSVLPRDRRIGAGHQTTLHATAIAQRQERKPFADSEIHCAHDLFVCDPIFWRKDELLLIRVEASALLKLTAKFELVIRAAEERDVLANPRGVCEDIAPGTDLEHKPVA